MQRKKMFLVVCISALLTGVVRGQNFLPQKSNLLPEHLEWPREAFHFTVLPDRDLSGAGKSARSEVLSSKGVGISVRRDAEIGAWRGAGIGTGSDTGGGTWRDAEAGLRKSIVIPANGVVTHFGFFCRRELELEKTIRLPLRFRLGSLEYCNRLEGK